MSKRRKKNQTEKLYRELQKKSRKREAKLEQRHVMAVVEIREELHLLASRYIELEPGALCGELILAGTAVLAACNDKANPGATQETTANAARAALDAAAEYLGATHLLDGPQDHSSN